VTSIHRLTPRTSITGQARSRGARRSASPSPASIRGFRAREDARRLRCARLGVADRSMPSQFRHRGGERIRKRHNSGSTSRRWHRHRRRRQASRRGRLQRRAAHRAAHGELPRRLGPQPLRPARHQSPTRMSPCRPRWKTDTKLAGKSSSTSRPAATSASGSPPTARLRVGAQRQRPARPSAPTAIISRRSRSWSTASSPARPSSPSPRAPRTHSPSMATARSTPGAKNEFGQARQTGSNTKQQRARRSRRHRRARGQEGDLRRGRRGLQPRVTDEGRIYSWGQGAMASSATATIPITATSPSREHERRAQRQDRHRDSPPARSTRLRSPRGQGYALGQQRPWPARHEPVRQRPQHAATDLSRRQQWIPGEDDRRDRGRLGSQHRARVRRHSSTSGARTITARSQRRHIQPQRSRPRDHVRRAKRQVHHGNRRRRLAHNRLSSEGRVYDWGFNDYGQLGNNTKGTDTPLPVAVDTTGALAGKTVAALGANSSGVFNLAIGFATTGPRILDVAAPTAKFHPAGDVLEFTVAFTNAVDVVTTNGTPKLALTIGTTARDAAYVSGSRDDRLRFRLHGGGGRQRHRRHLTVGSPIALGGGTIRDPAGLDATLAFTAPTTTGILIDTTPPAAPVITAVSTDSAARPRMASPRTTRRPSAAPPRPAARSRCSAARRRSARPTAGTDGAWTFTAGAQADEPTASRRPPRMRPETPQALRTVLHARRRHDRAAGSRAWRSRRIRRAPRGPRRATPSRSRSRRTRRLPRRA